MFNEKKKEKEIIDFGKKLSFLYIVLGVIGFFIIILPMIFYSNKKIDNLGVIGDTVGGLLNPILAVPATLLTFLAFWVQYKSNIETKEQFEKQNEDQLFFRLIDNLQNRIINYKTGSEDTYDLTPKSEGYNTLVVILNKLKNGIKFELTDFGRYLLAKNPEIIENFYFEKISKINEGRFTGSNVRSRLIKYDDFNDRWEYLKAVFNNPGHENREQEEILKSIGTVYFYKTNISLRKKYYEKIYSEVYRQDTVFLDGYLKNLEYIFDFISKSNYNKNFYINFLENNLTSHEKGIVFYYLGSDKINEFFKKGILDFKLLENLNLNSDFFVDSPSNDEFKKELESLIFFGKKNNIFE